MAPDLVSRFARLEEILSRLEGLASRLRREQDLEERDLRDLVERNLHLAVEALVDLADYLISRRGYRKPETSAEVFVVLAENGVVDRQFGGRLARWVRFRNILVHDYVRVDPKVVYRAMKEELGELRRMAEVLGRELEDELNPRR